MNFEHRNMGKMGSEFIVKHKRLKWSRLCLSIFVFSALATFVDLYSQEPFYLWIGVFILVVILLFRLYTKVIAETLLILPSIGLQIQTKYWLGTMATQFMDIRQVKDVIINEAIRPHKVLVYLTVLLRSEKSQEVDNTHPIFIHSWPTLDLLKEIYCAVQLKLFHYKSEKLS